MQFLATAQRVQLTVLKIKASGKDCDRRFVGIEFAMAVGLTESAGMPAFLKDAWSAMRKSGSQAHVTQLDGEIPSQNVRFYRLDKDKEADLEIADVMLEGLRLEKIGNRIELHFTIRQDLTKNLWMWAFYSFMRTVFAEFQEAQTELPLEESKDDLKVTISSPGLGSVEMTNKEFLELPEKIRKLGKKEKGKAAEAR